MEFRSLVSNLKSQKHFEWFQIIQKKVNKEHKQNVSGEFWLRRVAPQGGPCVRDRGPVEGKAHKMWDRLLDLKDPILFLLYLKENQQTQRFYFCLWAMPVSFSFFWIGFLPCWFNVLAQLHCSIQFIYNASVI